MRKRNILCSVGTDRCGRSWWGEREKKTEEEAKEVEDRREYVVWGTGTR